jgi:hypothetical protein
MLCIPHHWSQGIANNNLAALALKEKKFDEAHKHFDAAVDAARKLLAAKLALPTAPKGSDEAREADRSLRKARRTLGDRLTNQATLFFESNELHRIDPLLTEAYDIHRSISNMRYAQSAFFFLLSSECSILVARRSMFGFFVCLCF